MEDGQSCPSSCGRCGTDRIVRPPRSEQRELRGQLTLYGHGNELRALPAEEKVEVAPQPLLRFAVVTEVPFLLVEAAGLGRAAHVVQVLVVGGRLDEERRHVRRVQEGGGGGLAPDRG